MTIVFRSIVLLSIIITSNSGFGKDAPIFAFWNGTWKGDLMVYSATGEHLENVEVQFNSEVETGRAGTLQKIRLTNKSSKGYTEQQSGYYFMDSRGLRRIVKTSSGELSSDLRGRAMGPNQIYWFSVDVNGILREAYVETLNGEVAHVHGFHWDGERTGSYRIIEGRYTREKPELTSSKGSVP